MNWMVGLDMSVQSSWQDFQPVQCPSLSDVIHQVTTDHGTRTHELECFEELVQAHIIPSLPPVLDPHQFAYQANRSQRTPLQKRSMQP